MKTVKNQSLLILILLTISTLAVAQGYKIKVKVNGLKNDTLILGYHMDGKLLAKDTCKLDGKGIGEFKKKDPLPGGMYFVFLPSKNIFNFLVTENNQNFEIETDKDKYLDQMKFKNSPENDLFKNYEKFLQKQGEAMDKWQKLREQVKNNKDSTEIVKKNIDRINNEVRTEIDRIIKTHPKTFFATFLKATKDIEVPEPPKNEKGEPIEPNYRYFYYKYHYFDNIDFSEPKLLRTAIFKPKLMDFFEKIVIQVPDSINKEADKVLSKAKANKEVFKYVLGTLYNHYNQSNIMGMDAVFVNLAEYYINGEADWADTSFTRKIKEKVQKIKPNLLGKAASDFTAITNDNRLVRLHTIGYPFIMLYFYDPDCSHCATETPKAIEVFHRQKDNGLMVVGFCTTGDTAKWYKYIKDKKMDWLNVGPISNKFRDDYNIFSTPVVYLLDKDKKIIGKRIDSEQAEKLMVEKLLLAKIENLEGKDRFNKMKEFVKSYDLSRKHLEVVKEIVFLYKFTDDEKKEMEQYFEEILKKYPEEPKKEEKDKEHN